MSIKKPVPAPQARQRRLCPVCKQPSFSASGAHPQCLQRSNELLAKQQAALTVAAVVLTV